MKAREINQKMRSIMNTKVGLKAVGVFAVYITITSAISFIGTYLKLTREAFITFQYMMNLLVLPALSIGYQKFNLDLYRGKKANASTLFEGFTRRYFLKTVLVMFLFLISIIGLLFIIYVIYTLSLLGLVMSMNAGLSELIASIIIGILLIVLFLLFFYCVMHISQIYYRLIDNPSAGSWKALTSSIAMMKGRVWNYFVQDLSLLPLFLLPLIVNGAILLIYLVIFKDFPTFQVGNDWLANYVNITNALLIYLESKFTTLFIGSIITSLLVTPRISMAFAIWYDDKAREANLQIED